MSSRKLSSEEVEALMDGLKSSAHDVLADVSNSADVRTFQFGQDDLSLMGDYYALDLLMRVCSACAKCFSAHVTRATADNAIPAEVKSFDEYCESIDSFMNLNISRMEELRADASNNWAKIHLHVDCILLWRFNLSSRSKANGVHQHRRTSDRNCTSRIKRGQHFLDRFDANQHYPSGPRS